MKSLHVETNSLRLKSPLMTASGTSGHSNEIEVLKDSPDIISSLGAFVTKGVTLEPKLGNPELRIVETRSGIINSDLVTSKKLDIQNTLEIQLFQTKKRALRTQLDTPDFLANRNFG